ncbi:MAG TPA: hypothetical protein VFT14_00355 [Solirubrobacterales bacterium]|nr:hypothetical protein [Solirubrobacterales bacterium]
MFEATCEGLGLAIAAGLIVGVVLPAVMPGWGVIVAAAPLGVLAAAAALNGADEAIWPAFPVGVLGADLAAIVSRDVAAGAQRRASDHRAGGGEAFGGVTAIVVLAAVVLAAVSLLAGPISLVALVALTWLWSSRRRREARKHEGLRVLR